MKNIMNIVQTISKRDNGFRYNKDYDIALLRLKCYQTDVFQGVAPNENAIDYNPHPPMYACKFSSAPGYEHVIALANEDGKIALQDTSSKNGLPSEEPLEGTQAHTNAIFDLAWMPQELKLITASGDSTACLWDVYSDIKELQVFHGHTHSIKSTVFRKQDKAVFATGSRDGAIMIWDIRANHSGQPKPDNSIYNAHELKLSHAAKQRRTPSQSSKCSIVQSVTALTFQDDYTLLSCSAGDGLIKAWDLRKNYTVHKKEPIAKHSMNYGGKSNTYNGFTSLLICPAGITLYASCVDKKIYAYNIASYCPNPIAEYYGHGSDDKVLSFFVKACLSPDGDYLISGSNDETAYIWRTRNPGTPLIKLSGHRDEVTCIDWCSVGETKIVTCTDDSHHRVWRLRPETDDIDEQMNIFGHAELYQRPMDVSPRSLTVSSTPRSSCMESYNSDNSEESSKKPCHRVNVEQQSSEKRKCILSPIQESSPRRSSSDSRAARKLHFSPSTSNVQLSSPSKHNDVEQSTSRSNNLPATFSPTSGLPNYVIDGTAPHLLANSPRKSKENVDWLTMLRKRKIAEQGSCSKSAEDSPSPKNRKTPTRRISRLKSGETRKTTKNSPGFMPAITNFYRNLNLENPNVSSSCTS